MGVTPEQQRRDWEFLAALPPPEAGRQTGRSGAAQTRAPGMVASRNPHAPTLVGAERGARTVVPGAEKVQSTPRPSPTPGFPG